MSEWIKCSERMPDYDEEVLYGYWITHVLPDGDELRFDCRIGTVDDMRDDEASHWMSLPEPPKD